MTPKATRQLPNGLSLHRDLQVQAGNIHEIAWSPDGRFLASGNPDGQIAVWDVETGRLHYRLDRGDRLVWSVAWSPDGKRLASGSHQGVVGIWDAQSGERLRILERHDSWVRSVAWSPDGKRLATGSNDRTLAIWDTESGERIRLLEGHRDRVLSVRWSPDGTKLASASGDGTLIVWDPEAAEHLYRHQVRSGWLRSLAWSPEGRYVSCGSEDGVLRLWYGDDGKPAAVLEGHTESIGCTSFDSSGRMLASRAVDGRVRLWSSSRGSWQAVSSFKEPGTFPMQNLSFHPSKPLLATVAQSRIHVWEVDLDALLATADGRPAAPLRTAKVVCLGEPADQVEELARSLAGTSASLGERGPGVYLHSSQEVEGEQGPARREVLIWDLAERSAEHPWQQVADLRDAALAIVAFDPRAHEDPTPAIRTAVESVRRVSKAPVILVATGESAGSRHHTAMHAALYDLAPDDYLSLASVPSQEAGRLESRMLSRLDRLSLPVLESEVWLEEVETYLLQEVRAGRRMATADDLFRTFATRFQSGTPENERRRSFEACLRQLELRGLNRHLELGNLRIRPSLFGIYARAFANAGLADSEGLGVLTEHQATHGELPFAEGEQVEDPSMDRLLRMAMIEELVDLGLILREPSESGNLLLFPEALDHDRPPMPSTDNSESVLFKLQGPVDELLLSTMVKLARGSLFQLYHLYSDGARFTARFGGECGLRCRSHSARSATFSLSFSDGTSEETRLLFEETVAEHLASRLDSRLASRLEPDALQRVRVFSCSGCHTPVSDLQVERRRERGLDRISCPVCDTSISIRDGRDRLTNS